MHPARLAIAVLITIVGSTFCSLSALAAQGKPKPDCPAGTIAQCTPGQIVADQCHCVKKSAAKGPCQTGNKQADAKCAKEHNMKKGAPTGSQ